jgi:hypothetical protein
MSQIDVYTTLLGEEISIGDLPLEELALISDLNVAAFGEKELSDYYNFWMPAVLDFYSPKGIDRPQVRQTPGYRIGQDLASRRMIADGIARKPERNLDVL